MLQSLFADACGNLWSNSNIGVTRAAGMNIPNSITLMRIFFVPLLVAAMVTDSRTIDIAGFSIPNEYVALAIFLCAAATDLLDGYLARRWKQITTVGMLLDPVADKLLIS